MDLFKTAFFSWIITNLCEVFHSPRAPKPSRTAAKGSQQQDLQDYAGFCYCSFKKAGRLLATSHTLPTSLPVVLKSEDKLTLKTWGSHPAAVEMLKTRNEWLIQPNHFISLGNKKKKREWAKPLGPGGLWVYMHLCLRVKYSFPELQKGNRYEKLVFQVKEKKNLKNASHSNSAEFPSLLESHWPSMTFIMFSF